MGDADTAGVGASRLTASFCSRYWPSRSLRSMPPWNSAAPLAACSRIADGTSFASKNDVSNPMVPIRTVPSEKPNAHWGPSTANAQAVIRADLPWPCPRISRTAPTWRPSLNRNRNSLASGKRAQPSSRYSSTPSLIGGFLCPSQAAGHCRSFSSFADEKSGATTQTRKKHTNATATIVPMPPHRMMIPAARSDHRTNELVRRRLRPVIVSRCCWEAMICWTIAESYAAGSTQRDGACTEFERIKICWKKPQERFLGASAGGLLIRAAIWSRLLRNRFSPS